MAYAPLALQTMLNRACLNGPSVFYSLQGNKRGQDMAKVTGAIPGSRGESSKPLDWRKRMSDNIAYALLVYTVLQIFVTMGSLKNSGGSMLPYFALIILVAAIIPACRLFETRWNRLSDEQAADPQFKSFYRHDQLWLWAAAIGLPFAVSGLFIGLSKLFT